MVLDQLNKSKELTLKENRFKEIPTQNPVIYKK